MDDSAKVKRRPSEQDADELAPLVVNVEANAPEVPRSEVAPTYAPGERARSAVRVSDSGRLHLRSGLPPRARA